MQYIEMNNDYAIIDIEITDKIELIKLLITEYKLKQKIKKEIINIRFVDFSVYKAN